MLRAWPWHRKHLWFAQYDSQRRERKHTKRDISSITHSRVAHNFDWWYQSNEIRNISSVTFMRYGACRCEILCFIDNVLTCVGKRTTIRRTFYDWRRQHFFYLVFFSSFFFSFICSFKRFQKHPTTATRVRWKMKRNAEAHRWRPKKCSE